MLGFFFPKMMHFTTALFQRLEESTIFSFFFFCFHKGKIDYRRSKHLHSFSSGTDHDVLLQFLQELLDKAPYERVFDKKTVESKQTESEHKLACKQNNLSAKKRKEAFKN